MNPGRKEGAAGVLLSPCLFSLQLKADIEILKMELGSWLEGDLGSWCVKVKPMGQVESRGSIRPAEGLEEKDLILSHLCCLSGL